MSKVSTRIQQKRGTAADWQAAKNMVPMSGEIIVYNSEAGAHLAPRIKIGDGNTVVDKLPFLTPASMVNFGNNAFSAGEGVVLSKEQIVIGEEGSTTTLKPVSPSLLTTCGAVTASADTRKIKVKFKKNLLDADYIKLKALLENFDPTKKQFNGFVVQFNTTSGPQYLPIKHISALVEENLEADFLNYKESYTTELTLFDGFNVTEAIPDNHPVTEIFMGVALGEFSTAFNNKTLALGKDSHTEGNMSRTTATGVAGHAEGYLTSSEGVGAHAEGSGSTASGGAAHAEGSGTLASGQTAHAEGSNSQATANYAHAEGNTSLALASSAHAEGNHTTVNAEGGHSEGIHTVVGTTQADGTITGKSAHAEGYTTKAFGDMAHAEGNQTEASGQAAHAEGANTFAIAANAHAEGGNTHAEALNTHAEGQLSTASAQAAHAEGYNTTASGNNAHSEGSNTKATASSAHAEGYTTEASGAMSHAEGSSTHATASAAHAEGADTQATQAAAHAEGQGTEAFGNNAHAEGNATKAQANSAHAEGYKTKALGVASHAEGFGENIAEGDGAHAEGKSTKAAGAGAHAEGQGTKALAESAHAEGDQTEASGIASHAAGLKSKAIGMYSFARGNSCEAHAGNSVAEGYQNKVLNNGNGAHAEGYQTIANASYSHTEGNNTQTTGSNAHAEGNKTLAAGLHSHAEGSGSIAQSYVAHAEGQNTKAYGMVSHTEGQNTQTGIKTTTTNTDGTTKVSYSGGEGAHAEGRYTIASGDVSHAEGLGTKAGYFAQKVSGTYNKNKADTLYEIGNGTADDDRSNAFEVYKDGHAEVQTVKNTDLAVLNKKYFDKNKGLLTAATFYSEDEVIEIKNENLVLTTTAPKDTLINIYSHDLLKGQLDSKVIFSNMSEITSSDYSSPDLLSFLNGYHQATILDSDIQEDIGKFYDCQFLITELSRQVTSQGWIIMDLNFGRPADPYYYFTWDDPEIYIIGNTDHGMGAFIFHITDPVYFEKTYRFIGKLNFDYTYYEDGSVEGTTVTIQKAYLVPNFTANEYSAVGLTVGVYGSIQSWELGTSPYALAMLDLAALNNGYTLTATYDTRITKLDQEYQANSINAQSGVAVADALNQFMSVSETEPTNENTKIWVDPSQAVAEYVVEVGVKDGWRFRRYNTGFTEYWRRETRADLPISTSWGTIYDTGTRYRTADYPVPFSEIWNAQVSLSETNYEVIIGHAGSNDPLTQPPLIYGVRATTTATVPSVTLNYYASGYIDTNFEGTVLAYGSTT